MKRIMDRFNCWMNAITFAEAGEWETARQMMPPAIKKPDARRLSWFERTFMAVAFAEEGLHDEAIEIMKTQKVAGHVSDDVMETLGLNGIRLTYGVVSMESIT